MVLVMADLRQREGASWQGAVDLSSPSHRPFWPMPVVATSGIDLCMDHISSRMTPRSLPWSPFQKTEAGQSRIVSDELGLEVGYQRPCRLARALVHWEIGIPWP